MSTGLERLAATLAGMIGDGPRPVVVYAALWPLAHALKLPPHQLTDMVLDMLDEVVGSGRTLAMPTFTAGYQDGLCDLDAAPSTTGVLSEAFRRRPGVRRTVSAFFPFAVRGGDADTLVGLRPVDAWGDGSAYDWMERRDAVFLMLGCHPTHCSYLHRMEWLLADRIPYRFPKAIAGRVRHEGRAFDLTETLFVRSRSPDAINDFTVLEAPLQAGGMRTERLNGMAVSAMGAQAMRAVTERHLSADPLLVLKNREDFATREP